MGDRLGVTLKAQQSDYNPNQEKLDSSRAKADVELINSSVDEIPEAVSILQEETSHIILLDSRRCVQTSRCSSLFRF